MTIIRDDNGNITAAIIGNGHPQPPHRSPRQCLAEIGWSQAQLACMLDINDRTIRRWVGGHEPAPDWLMSWLAPIAAFHAAHPAPERPQQ